MAADRMVSERGRKATRPTPDRSAEAGGGIDSRIQLEIGRQLRAAYDDIVNEPVPDRFLSLLQQLERSARKPS